MSEEKEVGATFVLDVVTGIRQGALSPVALIDELIARIDSLNPRLRAFISVARESARAGARAAERTLVADGACGPLHGVPYACKDVFWTRDLPTTAGSRVLEGWTAEQDATAVQRATGAGAILIGKTNLHEFAYGATGENPHSGTVPNPWDAKRIAGGSSSGSAAAVACDLVPFALGTDTGGSVRVPAALCGVVGIKPTYGLVSTHGVIPFCWSLDHVGIFTRSVADAALVLEVLAGHDPHDPASASVNVPNYGRALSGDLRGLSVGVPRQHFFDRLDPEIEAAALDVLGHIERLGGRIIDVEPPDLSSARTVALLLQMPEALSYHSQFLRDKRELYGEELRSGLVSRFRSSHDFRLVFSGFDCSEAEPLDGGEDVIGGFGPFEGFGVLVCRVDVVEDGALQLLGGAMDAAPDLFVGQQPEPALDLVEPGGAGGCEMGLPARPFGEPVADRLGLVGPVVVHDDVDVEISRDVRLDEVEEFAELSGPMARETFADDLSRGDVEGREERGRAVALVVVAAPLRLPGAHRQEGLGTVQGLDLALFVDTENQGTIRRRQIQTDDVEPPDLSSARTVALLLQMPEALSYHSQFRARRASPCDVLRRRDSASNSARSSSLKEIVTATLAINRAS